jgi:hypothetical protein
VIPFDVPDEIVCTCGWSEAAEYAEVFEEDVRRRAAERGISRKDIAGEFDGDLETWDSFLRALERDD